MRKIETGILMIRVRVPKNLTQGIVVVPDMLQEYMLMNKYTIQITITDERDGAL